MATVDGQSVLDTLGYRQRVVCAVGHSAWFPGPKSIALRAALRADAEQRRAPFPAVEAAEDGQGVLVR